MGGDLGPLNCSLQGLRVLSVSLLFLHHHLNIQVINIQLCKDLFQFYIFLARAVEA